MPLNFPNSPTNGQIFSSGIKKWTYSTAEQSWLASNYAPSPENVNGIVKSDGAGNFSAAVAGTDYQSPISINSSSLLSGPVTITSGTYAIFATALWRVLDGTSDYSLRIDIESGSTTYTSLFGADSGDIDSLEGKGESRSTAFRVSVSGSLTLNYNVTRVGITQADSPIDQLDLLILKIR